MSLLNHDTENYSDLALDSQRYRLAIYSMFANIFSKAGLMLVMVLSVNLTLPYLGTDKFGIWMTIASFSSMLIFLDMGLGNALTNRVAHQAVSKNKKKLNSTISGGVGLLAIVCVFICSLTIFVSLMIPWESVIKTDAYIGYNYLRDSILVFCVFFSMSIFSLGVQKVFHGLQKAYVAHTVNFIFSLLSIVTLFVATHFKADISYLLISTLGVQSFNGFFLLLVLYNKKLFSFHNILINSLIEKRYLFRVGGLFLLLQLGTMASVGADSLIISSVAGASLVAVYNIGQRLFQFVSQPIAIFNSPFWGAYADAYHRKHKEFIRKTLLKSVIFSFLFSLILGAVLLLFSSEIIYIWTKGSIEISINIVFCFFLWVVFESTANSLAMFMNGCDIIKPQVFATISLVIVTLPLKIYILSRYGLESMILAFLIFFVFNLIFWYGLVFRKKILSKLLG